MQRLITLSRAIDRDSLIERFQAVRRRTTSLCDPLSPEDMTVQVETCASPTKWHLAHTTWFFESFVLAQHEPGFAPYDERFNLIFNSYYRTMGERHPRHRRGVLTRPGIGEVIAFRDTVDERVVRLLRRCDGKTLEDAAPLIILGLNHEQQHQELLLTDIRLLLHANPLAPAYREREDQELPAPPARALAWTELEGGVVEIGAHPDEHEFFYDNEGPRHRRFLEPYALADRLTTNGEYLEFIEDRGYERPELWLDLGIDAAERGGWRHPMFWRRDGGSGWLEFTLDGLVTLDLNAPLSGVSFFEADAFARWRGARLPTEDEWEHAAADIPIDGSFIESGRLRPAPDPADGAPLRQMLGEAWQWTRSAHEPYPGYRPPPGAVGEYNGKFMCNQYVLRGGSCATSRSHIRRTYRNFFEPDARWQFAGVRLARSIR